MLRLTRPIAFCAFLIAIMAPGGTGARGDVLAHIDISDQRLDLYVDGEKKETWPVSTGLHRGWTPTGTWRPYFLSRHHRSTIFGNAPMPYAVFYDRDWAIHGTDQLRRLGAPASKGCVRLHPKHAAVLFDLVLQRARTTR